MVIEKVEGATLTDDATLEVLRDMFRHHAWATLQLIDYCAVLTPEQLSESLPGTRGPILETLRHIVGVDYGYKMRFRVQEEDPPWPEVPDLSCWAYWASERIPRQLARRTS